MSTVGPEPYEVDFDSSEATVEIAAVTVPREELERRRLERRSASRKTIRLRRIRFGLAAVLTVVLLVMLFTGGGEGSKATSEQAASGDSPSAAAAGVVPPELRVAEKGVLRVGSKGAKVRRLQRALTVLGFSPGAVDGTFGEQSGQAVANFQLAHNLAPTGVVRPATARLINQTLTELAKDVPLAGVG